MCIAVFSYSRSSRIKVLFYWVKKQESGQTQQPVIESCNVGCWIREAKRNLWLGSHLFLYLRNTNSVSFCQTYLWNSAAHVRCRTPYSMGFGAVYFWSVELSGKLWQNSVVLNWLVFVAYLGWERNALYLLLKACWSTWMYDGSDMVSLRVLYRNMGPTWGLVIHSLWRFI